MKRSTKRSIFIEGILRFGTKYPTLESDGITYFVQSHGLKKWYLSGDRVITKYMKGPSNGQLPEVKIERLLTRSTQVFVGTLIDNRVTVIRPMGTLEGIEIMQSSRLSGLIRFVMHGQKANVLWEFVHPTISDPHIALLFFAENIPTEWSIKSQKRIKELEKTRHTIWLQRALPHKHRLWRFFSGLKTIPINSDIFPHIQEAYAGDESRIDFRNWYTYSIDWHDARDLDDALSFAEYDNGDILLGVHIADVSHFVWSGDVLDKDAYIRGTSIYTPEFVVPMLPEILSNHLCSLHPGSPKRTLSCLMRIDQITGAVTDTYICHGIIENQYAWKYDDIDRSCHMNDTNLSASLSIAWKLYDQLKARRKKEGKIVFLREEVAFWHDAYGKVMSVWKQNRKDSHMLIEECMVLANEEVAKWCRKRRIPFLSRVHPKPVPENINLLRSIMGMEWKQPIAPRDIRDYFDTQPDYTSCFRATQLILPKMAKAIYSETGHGHFALALDEYTHFTSPIRRYPDLITHRMIREFLLWNRYQYRSRMLAHIAKQSSYLERRAESVSMLVKNIHACRLMESSINKECTGRISGFYEHIIFVLLENGLEISLMWQRDIYTVDSIHGTALSRKGEIIYTIGDHVNCKLTHIDWKSYRILGSLIGTSHIKNSNYI